MSSTEESFGFVMSYDSTVIGHTVTPDRVPSLVSVQGALRGVVSSL